MPDSAAAAVVAPEPTLEPGAMCSGSVPSAPRQGLIDVADVSMVFGGSRSSVTALASVSFRIEPGRFVSVLGPSGCGKSTLLMILAGLEQATSGEVLINGKTISSPYPELGMVFQRDLLLEWRTVLDNVLVQVELRGLKRKDFRNRAEELLAMVGLSDFSAHYPSQLSGGMRQRVAICRALIHSPRILLMDEPFGALDALTREQLNLDIARISEDYGATTVFVTHSIDEAVFLGDEILIFSSRPGRVVERLPIDIERPRRLAEKREARFTDYVAHCREVFQREGVLHDAQSH